MLTEKIDALLAEVNALTASNAEEIEALRLKYLSKKGEINALMADFRNVPAEDKKAVGVKIKPTGSRTAWIKTKIFFTSIKWMRPSVDMGRSGKESSP